MKLEFIDVSPADQKQHPTVRKRIRAQAMRSYRRQQRIDRESFVSVGTSNGALPPMDEEEARRSRRFGALPSSMSFLGRSITNPLDEGSAITSMFSLCEQCRSVVAQAVPQWLMLSQG